MPAAAVPKEVDSRFEKQSARKLLMSLERARRINQGNQTTATKGLRKFSTYGLLARRDGYAGIDCRR
jgi:hypothetical protein